FMMSSFRLSRAGVPSTPCARTGAQPGGRSLSEAADGFGDKLMPLELIHALQAMSDGECSVSEGAGRDHARDLCLLARQGTALQVSGVGTQQPEHVRNIVFKYYAVVSLYEHGILVGTLGPYRRPVATIAV